MSTLLKVEPIGFQQNVPIEHDYQTAISDYEMFENSENFKNNLANTMQQQILRTTEVCSGLQLRHYKASFMYMDLCDTFRPIAQLVSLL